MHTVEYSRCALGDGAVLLDLGCGSGRHALSACCSHGVHVVGIDLQHPPLRDALQKKQDLDAAWHPEAHFLAAVADGTRLPFPDASLTHVVCSEVLEHIHEYPAVLREISRTLSPGGVLALSVPRFWPEWLCWRLSSAYHNQEGGHIRIFRARRLRREIEALGFHCYGRHWAHALHTPFWWLQCLLRRTPEESRLLRLYHRLLVWDLMARPRLTRVLERLLNPVLGKSVVLYFRKKCA